jgi:hypothetical protein
MLCEKGRENPAPDHPSAKVGLHGRRRRFGMMMNECTKARRDVTGRQITGPDLG